MDKEILGTEAENEEMISENEENLEEQEEIQEDIQDENEETEETQEELSVDEITAEESEEREETEQDSDSEEDSKEEEETEEIKLCPACHEAQVTHDNEYCYRCMGTLKKTKIPVTGYIVGLGVLVLSLFTFVTACLISAPSLQVVKGDIYASKKNWAKSFEAYSQVTDYANEVKGIIGNTNPLSKAIMVGSRVHLKQFEAVTHLYDPIQALNFLPNVFTNPNAEKFYKRTKLVKKCTELSDKFQATFSALSEPIDKLYQVETPTAKLGEMIIRELEVFRGKEGVDDVLLDFMIYNVAGYCMCPDEVLHSYLDILHEKAQKADTDYSFMYMEFYTKSLIDRERYDEAIKILSAMTKEDISKRKTHQQLISAYVRKGDMEKANKVAVEFFNNNETADGIPSDSAYAIKIQMARYNGKYDLVKILYEEANAAYSTNLEPEFDRQMALVLLLEGDYDQAFEKAYAAEGKAYYRATYYQDNGGYSDELLNTTYLCAYLCKEKGKKNTENAQYLDEIVSSLETQITSEIVKQIIDGKLSVKDALTKGARDLV